MPGAPDKAVVASTDTATVVSPDDLNEAPAVDAPKTPTASTAEVPTDANAAPAGAPAGKRRRSKKPFVIAAVVVALIAAGGGAGYYFGVYAPEQAREAAEQETLAAKHAVRFTVSAQGWDTSAGASRLPLHITGKEERGHKVDVVDYVDSKGDGVKLRRGKYKAEVAASPIAADGTIYAVPGDEIDLKIGEKTAEKKAVDGGSVSLDPIEATEVTDDEVAAAKKYAEEDKDAKKDGLTFDADALATAATKRRDDAVAAKQAEEEAKRQAEEAAKKAAEAKQARTIETDYFTMVLPNWFPIDDYEVTTQEPADVGNGVGKCGFTRVYKKEGENGSSEYTSFSIYVYENDMPGVGGVVKQVGTSKGLKVMVLTGGTPPKNAFGMSADDYANTLASCITLK